MSVLVPTAQKQYIATNFRLAAAEDGTDMASSDGAVVANVLPPQLQWQLLKGAGIRHWRLQVLQGLWKTICITCSYLGIISYIGWVYKIVLDIFLDQIFADLYLFYGYVNVSYKPIRGTISVCQGAWKHAGWWELLLQVLHLGLPPMWFWQTSCKVQVPFLPTHHLVQIVSLCYAMLCSYAIINLDCGMFLSLGMVEHINLHTPCHLPQANLDLNIYLLSHKYACCCQNTTSFPGVFNGPRNLILL